MSDSELKLRIAVITDLHYSSHKVGSDTCYLPQCAIGYEKDPMDSLIATVRESTSPLRADFLLCPGDIADKANHLAFKAGWGKLKVLKEALGAQHLIAATGNHEVNSRSDEEEHGVHSADQTLDPIGLLQEIEDYPTDFSATPDKRWVYWGKGYEIIHIGAVCLVLINSCHFHVTMNQNEYERGSISDRALKLLEQELASIKLDDKKFRIVLLHHHPIPHQDLSIELGQIEMHSGSKLIQVLENTYADWLIVHGHKHHPRLLKAQGSPTSSPTIFAAGSFGAALRGALATRTKNQFYILELEALKNSADKYQLKGRVEAYYWTNSEWRTATEKSHGLPHGCGFDRHIDPDDLSPKVRDAIKDLSNAGKSYVRWTELQEKFEELKYLTPAHIDHLRKNLEAQGVQMELDNGVWFPSELNCE